MANILQVPQIVAETITGINSTSSFNNSDFYKSLLETKVFKHYHEVSEDEVSIYSYKVPIENFPISTITNISGVKVKYIDGLTMPWMSCVIIDPYGSDNLIVFGDNILKAEFLLLQDRTKLNQEEYVFIYDMLESVYYFYNRLYQSKKFDQIDVFFENLYCASDQAFSVMNTIALACTYFTFFMVAYTGGFDHVTIKKNIKTILEETSIGDDINMNVISNLFLIMQNKEFDDLQVNTLSAFDPLFEED